MSHPQPSNHLHHSQVQVGQSSNDSHQVATAATATVSAPTTVNAPPPPNGAEKPANDVFAGAMARAASQSTIHPLDTMKVRMQAGKPGPGMLQIMLMEITVHCVSQFPLLP